MSREMKIKEMACAICGNSRICVGEGVDKCILHPQMWRYANNAYREGYRKQEWISVKDRLPESSCECLVATNIGGIYQVNYSHRYKAFNALDTDEAKYAMLNVTHWMPLPEPPKGE